VTNPECLEMPALREKHQQQVFAFIDRELNHLSFRITWRTKREESEERAMQTAAVLPSVEVLEKILRYETKLERQLYRALGQLERLQRMRRGEAVPPPLTLEVLERE